MAASVVNTTTADNSQDLQISFFGGGYGQRQLTPAEVQAKILERFDESQQALIVQTLDILGTLGKFLSKDFEVPVELSEPGSGWHYDASKNVIRVDPNDLLTKETAYLRFVMAHEAAHRRITRLDLIPPALWEKPGYSFMTNVLEDPRVNNFTLENYSYFAKFVGVVYESIELFESETKQIAEAMLGHKPRFVLAGLEYIKLWLDEHYQVPKEIDSTLPEEVRSVIRDTIEFASKSWNTYPNSDESGSKDAVAAYARASIKINSEQIWPEFKKLLELDLKDQKIEELLRQMSEQAGQDQRGGSKSLPKNLTPEELEQLKELLQNANPSPGNQRTQNSVPLDGLSEEMKEKLREHIKNLSPREQERLEQAAEEKIKEFEKRINKLLEKMLSESETGELSDDAKAQRTKAAGDRLNQRRSKPSSPNSEKSEPGVHEPEEIERTRKIVKGENRYTNTLRQMKKMIEQLEGSLKRVFKKEKLNRWKPNFNSGRSIDIRTRISELADGTEAVESRAWRRKAAPVERDYAISILIDVTGSMNSDKVREAFKALVTVAEPLARLGVKMEVIGFNSELYIYKRFNEKLSEEARARIGTLPDETQGSAASYTDDGWALNVASARLGKVEAKKKFIIICTDGESNLSPAHSQPENEVDEAIRRIREQTDQVVIGLGIGHGTEFVSRVYPNNLANIDVHELPKKLAQLLEEIVKNHGQFRR